MLFFKVKVYLSTDTMYRVCNNKIPFLEIINLLHVQAKYPGVEIATDTVANADNISFLETKSSCLCRLLPVVFTVGSSI